MGSQAEGRWNWEQLSTPSTSSEQRERSSNSYLKLYSKHVTLKGPNKWGMRAALGPRVWHTRFTALLVHEFKAGAIRPPRARPSHKPVWVVTSLGPGGLGGRWINRHLPISSSSLRNVPSSGWPVRPGHRKCSLRGLPSLAPHQCHLPNSDTWENIEKGD